MSFGIRIWRGQPRRIGCRNTKARKPKGQTRTTPKSFINLNTKLMQEMKQRLDGESAAAGKDV